MLGTPWPMWTPPAAPLENGTLVGRGGTQTVLCPIPSPLLGALPSNTDLYAHNDYCATALKITLSLPCWGTRPQEVQDGSLAAFMFPNSCISNHSEGLEVISLRWIWGLYNHQSMALCPQRDRIL